MIKQFTKLIDSNPDIDCCIATIVGEYDIASAHTTACYFIFGKEKYDELMSMEKLARNTKIGIMMKNDPSLHEKIAALLLKWFNLFCEENNIKESNFISSTRDSLLLVNKKPIHTIFENGLVNFRNKDGEFTSYIRLGHMEILYDRMSDAIRIKGVNSEYVNGHPFVKILRQLLALLESSSTMTVQAGLKKLSQLRNKYINSPDAGVYRSLLDNNKFVYMVGGERILSDVVLPETADAQLVKHDNYVNYILPIVKIYFKPH